MSVMGIGDIRAAVTVILSIRDDWAEQRDRRYTAYGGRPASSAVVVSPAEEIQWIHGSRKAE